MIALQVALALSAFPDAVVETKGDRIEESAAAGDPRYVRNACRDLEDRELQPLARDDDNRLWTAELQDLFGQTGIALRYREGAPALVVQIRPGHRTVVGKSPRGVTRVSGEFDNNFHPTGVWRFFGDTGRLQWEANFSSTTEPYGAATARVCADGARGRWTGKSFELECVHAAVPNGRSEVRNLVGIVTESGQKIDGKRYGLWAYYRSSGCRERLESYVDGELDGATVAWFGPDNTDGDNTRYRGQFKSGFAVGLWQYWCDGAVQRRTFEPSEKAVLSIRVDACGPPAAPSKATPAEPETGMRP